MPPFFNNQRLERITYIEICYLKLDVGSAMLASARSSFYRSANKKKYSTLTKVTIQRFTSMLVAMGGDKLQICVLWI